MSSIAEILYTHNAVCPNVPKTDRETYLKHVREAFSHLTLSPLRKHLGIVERNITANTFDQIQYERVPSKAMNFYQKLFIKKDQEHLESYLDRVAEGKAQISGAILLPQLLVHKARKMKAGRGNSAKIEEKVLDGQWNTLVQRIRDSRQLQSAIAVCDVSGSMMSPTFPDDTQPLDAAIGLSLLLAEVTEPPFGGVFITFSQNPVVEKIGGRGDTRTFKEKVQFIVNSQWHHNTNFVAVFEDLILPMALENEIKPQDMVRQVFVFSDMQFDAAEPSRSDARWLIAPRHDRWSTSSERTSREFKKAGYDMPQLIF